MISTEESPTLQALCIFFTFFCGVVIFGWGKKLAGKGVWIVWAGLLVLLMGVGIDSALMVGDELKVKIWMAGWILPRNDPGAMNVGVLQDSLGYAMSVLAAVLSMTLILQNQSLAKESRVEKAYAAIAVSCAGMALAWNSLTPWLAFIGILLTLCGGFISLGMRWDSNPEATVAARFAWERGSGLLLAMVGGFILAVSRPALFLNAPELWQASSDNSFSVWVGASLLATGLFIQLQPFPFLGSLVFESEIYAPLRTLLNQIFPAWASFALLVRLAPQLTNLGVLPVLGWFALASAALVIFSGLFQRKWRQGLGVWLAAGQSLSCAYLALSDPLSGMAMMLGVSLGALILSGSAVSLEAEFAPSQTTPQKALWLKAACFIAAAAGTGVLGFVSATGGIRWVMQAMDQPVWITVFLCIFFLHVLLGWKMAWKISQLQNEAGVSWATLISIWVCVILSLGVIWTGTVTGGILPGSPDRLFPSIFLVFFKGALEFPQTGDYLTASSLYWGTLFLAFILAYWMSGRKEDQWVRLSQAFPKTSRFLSTGYGVDGTSEKALRGMVWLGEFTERLIDFKVWSEWLPNGLSWVIKKASDSVAEIDRRISSSLTGGLRTMVEVPAKILQLVQTGDLRWYLLFALSSGFALLSHFLRG